MTNFPRRLAIDKRSVANLLFSWQAVRGTSVAGRIATGLHARPRVPAAGNLIEDRHDVSNAEVELFFHIVGYPIYEWVRRSWS